MNETRMNEADARRMGVLEDKAREEALDPEEIKELSRLRALWRTTHAAWDRTTHIAPATRIPGVELPRRKDPYGG
jgi:hypothetical protein